MAKAIIPWMGGKRRLAKQILPLVNGHRTYIEPFCGGASIFFLKDEAKVEVINDINGELINLYRVVKHHLDELVRHFRWSLVSREEFVSQTKTDPETLTDIQRAARFYYLMKNCFGGNVKSKSFGTSKTCPPKMNLLRIEEDLSTAHLRLSRVLIENKPWHAMFASYDSEESCFYLDPPYWQTAGYGTEFPFEEYQRMAELMAEAKGKVVLSINDHPDIRALFKGFSLTPVDIKYTVGGGHKKAGELIITN